jgi:DNA-binding NarL/FixJ family response regulator
MRRLSEGLEANLKEKKDLSQHILEQLDQGLKKAQETSGELSKIMLKAGSLLADPSQSQGTSSHTRSAVESLLAKGLTREEVAKHLGISGGEIDLLLKLRPARDRSKPASDTARPKP